MTELELKIKDAAQKYYTDGSSPYTDAEFDAMVAELKATNSDSELLKVGWGYDVTLDSTPGAKLKHKYGTAGSLDKCHNWSELKQLQTADVDISLKLDGLSVVLYYQDGKLVRALTRGDGNIGIDITHKVVQISDIFKELPDDVFTGAIRGEILMSYSNFDAYKQIHPEAKNPRNSTAGVINGKDTDSDLKFLSLIVYTIVGYEASSGFEYLSYVRAYLEYLFGSTNVVPHIKDVVLSEQTFDSQMEMLRNTWYGQYPADGLVITNNVLKIHGDAVEYDAKAYKFSAEQKECEVQEVIWNMTKSHYAMPKIRIMPVELAGTTVEYCTGYNAKYIFDNGIGPGAVVKVWKANEIIPNITEVITPVHPDMIHTCPDCGAPLSWDGVHLKCTNPVCGNAVLQDTLIYMKTLAPTDGLSDLLITKFLNELVDIGLISDISIESIMNCTASFNDTSSVQANLFHDMWYKLHNNAVNSYAALLSLNIPRLGDKTCDKLTNHPAVIQQLIKEASWESGMRIDTYNTLVSIVGNATAESINSHLSKFKRLQYVNILYDNIDTSATINSKGKVAITGKLSVSRSIFIKELKAAGYVVVDSVNKDTKFLITDNPDSSSSKNKQADKFGVAKITESEFRTTYM